MSDGTRKGREDNDGVLGYGMVELSFRVEVDQKDPRTVVMDLGVAPKVKMRFETEEDAKRADTMLTMFAQAFYLVFCVGGGEPTRAPTTWDPGTMGPSTQKGVSAEGVAEEGDGADNSTKTQKDGGLSCGADGAAPAKPGQGGDK